MINKENNNNPDTPIKEEESGFIEVAFLDMQCHILIKDAETDEILVNKRG